MQMTQSRLGWIGYLVFLAGYAAYKYLVAAPPAFSPAYAQSVATLVVLTGIAPFFGAYLILKIARLGHVPQMATGLLLGLALCVAGYALFWLLFLSSLVDGPQLVEVATRGVGWGLAQGALAGFAASRPAS